MSKEIQEVETQEEASYELTEEQELPVESEVKMLKTKADVLGIKYPSNATAKKMKELIDAHLKELEEREKQVENKTNSTRKVTLYNGKSVAELRDEAWKMVRIKLIIHDPQMAQRAGYTFNIGNSVVGMTRHHVPMDERFYENGYHLPYIVVEHLKSMTYSRFNQAKVQSEGKGFKNSQMVERAKSFTVIELPPLTDEELRELGEQQAINRTLED